MVHCRFAYTFLAYSSDNWIRSRKSRKSVNYSVYPFANNYLIFAITFFELFSSIFIIIKLENFRIKLEKKLFFIFPTTSMRISLCYCRKGKFERFLFKKFFCKKKYSSYQNSIYWSVFQVVFFFIYLHDFLSVYIKLLRHAI